MGKVEENGELYEAHTLRSGEVIWFYSYTLHKLMQISELYGFDIYTLNGIKQAKIIHEKTFTTTIDICKL